MKTLTSMGLKHERDRLLALDQQRLPAEESWIECTTPATMIECIRSLAVRGAPLIGVAAALSLAKFAESGASKAELNSAAHALREARPTAVNLMHAIDRMLKTIELGTDAIIHEAEKIFEEDVALCEAMAQNGAALVKDGEGILTHCNTGGLATVGAGTALSAIRRAHEQGKRIHVYVDETRPLLQGGRLTAWELEKLKIPHTLICDNMAATLMRQGNIQRVFVGSDRVAANGDFANKIGTYSVAVCAKYHDVAFHPVAPWTTVDLKCKTGEYIPIEERKAHEVRGAAGSFGDVTWAPANAPVWNPAFDVTPAALVTSLVLDTGVYARTDLETGILSRIKG